MGTISKALGKYKEQRNRGHASRTRQSTNGSDRGASTEAGGSVSGRMDQAADATASARLPKARHRLRGQDDLPTVPPIDTEPLKDDRRTSDPEARLHLTPTPPRGQSAAPPGRDPESSAGTETPSAQAFHPKLVVITKPYSFEAEQFKLLRSSLLFPVNGKAPRSILVTSTDPGEGKTLVSANLAASIALNLDRSVLLIDCDLRRPFLHELLGFGECRGLSEYLSGRCSLASLLLKTPLDRFSFLPAGQIPVNPAELLNSAKMFELMDEVRNRYADRLVIIDSPPPMLAAESNALARAVDGVLLVIKYRATRRENAAELVEKIGKDKILGTVLNFTDRAALGYYRAKKYGYKYYDQTQEKKRK